MGNKAKLFKSSKFLHSLCCCIIVIGNYYYYFCMYCIAFTLKCHLFLLNLRLLLSKFKDNWFYHLVTAWSVQIRSYFWSVFCCIRTEYGDWRVNLRVQSEYRKIRTRNNCIWTLFLKLVFLQWDSYEIIRLSRTQHFP